MAITLTTSWQNIAKYEYVPGTGFKATFWLDARYTTQSIPNNNSHIEVRLTSGVQAGSGSGDNYGFGASYCGTVSGGGRWYIANETITSGSGDVAHNADGSKTINISGWGYINGAGLSFNISADCILPKIPRYATCTQSSTGKTETSINMKWTSDSTCDYVWYSTNNGSSWTAIGSVNASSGTYSIPNLTANTSYNIKTRIRRNDSQLTTDSTALNISTYDYPKVSNAPVFKIGDNPTIGIYNPLGRSCKIYLIGNHNNQKEIGTITTESISGINTAAWKTWLYNSIPNSKTGNYKIRIVVSALSRDNTFTGNSYSIRDDGSELPNFSESNWSYIANLTSLTKNNQAVINGNSQITFSVNTQATSSFGATITGYIYKWGSKSSTNGSVSLGEGSILEVDAVDSRGLIKPTTKILVSGSTYIPYTKPTLDYSSSHTHRTDGISTEVRITLRGNLSVIKFGELGINNTVYDCKYRVYNYSTNTWSGPYNIPANNFTLNENGVYRLSNYLIHANGSSGGFTTGVRYGIEIILKDGNGLLATLTTSLIQITDGKIAKDVFQDGEGNYHQGINGLADDDYTEKIYGNTNIDGKLDVNDDITYKGTLLEDLLNSDSTPIGIILPYTSSNIPSGFMLCDGRAISRTTYKDLFDIIGTTYGSGDGSTTFNLPNIKGKVGVGLDTSDTDFDTVGKTGGEKTHTLTINEIPSHNHNQGSGEGFVVSATSGASAHIRNDGNAFQYAHKMANVGGGQAHNNLQPYVVLVYIIKVANGNATVPESVIISNADVLQITQNKNDITSLKNSHKGDYVTLRRNTDLTWVAGGQGRKDKFPFTQVYSSSGTGLSAYDNNQRVKVGSGVSAVRVTYHLNKNEEDFSYNWIMGYIYKNNTILKRSITKADRWAQLDDTMIVPVQKGDIIGIYVETDRSGNIMFPTYDSFASCGGMQILNVEVVK